MIRFGRCRRHQALGARTSRQSSFGIAAALLIGFASASIASPAGHARDAEHQRIAAERASAKARLAAREHECNQRFIVSSCVNAAREEERAVLSRLRHEELALDDAQRRDEAESLRAAQAVKDGKQAAAASEAASNAAAVAASSRDAPRHVPQRNPGAPRAAGSGLGINAGSPTSAAAQRATEARNQAEFEARARAAETHREAIEKRNAERAASGKAAQPLPVPLGVPALPPSSASAVSR